MVLDDIVDLLTSFAEYFLPTTLQFERLSAVGFLVMFYVLVIIFVTYLLLCRDSNNDAVSRFSDKLFIVAGRFCTCLIGKRNVNRINNTADYCCNKPNPFFQLFYLLLVLGGYGFFIVDTLPLIPTPMVPFYHKYTAILAVAITISTFIISSKANPGKITKSTASHFTKSFPYDEMLYSAKECRTCLFNRPARSKHCSFCDICVSRYDHHCPWINNCVGENNLRYFLLFLFSTATLCLYCCYLCTMLLYSMLDSQGVFKMMMKDPLTKKNTPAPISFLLQYVLYYGGTTFPLGFFCGVISLVLYGFLGYHCYLICRNTTTNETYKWGDYARYVEYWMKREKQNELKKNDEKDLPSNVSTDSKNLKKRKDDKKSDKSDFDELSKPKFKLNSKGKMVLKNIYQKGIIKNFYEVFVPPSYRSQ